MVVLVNGEWNIHANRSTVVIGKPLPIAIRIQCIALVAFAALQFAWSVAEADSQARCTILARVCIEARRLWALATAPATPES